MWNTRRALLLCGTAMAVAAALPVQAQEMKAEVIHWWTSGGEVRRREGVRRPVQGGRRRLGRHRHRRRRERAHRRHQPHRRRQSADRDAVQHRQAVRRAGRPTACCATSRGGRGRQVARGPAAGLRRRHTRDGKIYAVPVNIHGQNWLWYNTKVLRRGRHRAEPKTGTTCSRPRQAEGGGPDPARPGRPALAGAHRCSTPCWSATAARTCSMQVYGDGNVDAVKSAEFKEVAEIFGKLRDFVDPGSPGRNWNDATAHGDHRQGRRCRSWATGPRASSSPPA